MRSEEKLLKEIAALMKEASHLGPKDSLRPFTYVALIGLIASSGLRVGEALRLKVGARPTCAYLLVSDRNADTVEHCR